MVFSSKAIMPFDSLAHTEFVAPIREAVEARRARGMKTAFHEVARLFGLSERRVRAAVYGEVRQVLASEVMQVRHRLAIHLEQEAARLDAQAALLRVRLDALRETA